ncbi:MAG: sugar-binding protein [Planctomycetota bacterium]
MNRLFGSGGLDYMDILSIHADVGGMTPSGPNMPEEEMGGGGTTVSQAFSEITELMRAYGEVKPIWNTEHPIFCMPFSRLYPWVDDVPWTRQDPPQDPVQGAQFVVRSTIVEMTNNCPRNFFYPFPGGRYEDGDLTSSIMSGHMRLKSSGVVMSELLLQLGQATLHRKVDWGAVARCYLFKTPEGPVAVAWGLRAHERPGTLRLPLDAAQFTYLDIMGNERRDVEKADACALPLGAEPVYIRASDMGTLEAALAAGKVTGLMPAQAGEVLRKEPGLQEGLSYAGDAELAADLQAYAFDKGDRAVAILASKRTDSPKLTLSEIPGVRIREIGADIDVSEARDGGKSFEVSTTPIVIEAPDLTGDALLAQLEAAEISGLVEFDLEGIWVTSIKGELQLTVRLRNTSRAEVSPAITVTALPPGVSLESKDAAMSPLAPGKTGQVDMPLRYAKAPEELAGEVTMRVEGGREPVTSSRRICLAFALPAKSPVAVDGDLSEWTDEGRFQLKEKRQVVIGQAAWKGPEDLSATLRARYDDNFLYLAVEVRDDFPDRRNEAMQLWNGTSVEVFVDANQREDLGRSFYDKDDFQFLFGPATATFPTDLWGIAPHSGKSHLPGLAMKSKHIAGGYAMEIAFPREIFAMELLPGVLQAAYGPGLSMGISIVANDRPKEQEGRKSSIVWGGTIRNYLDPSKFGTLVLLP